MYPDLLLGVYIQESASFPLYEYYPKLLIDSLIKKEGCTKGQNLVFRVSFALKTKNRTHWINLCLYHG